MILNQRGIDLIKNFEKCRLNAYQDSKGIWTIGWGATFYQNENRVKKGDSISQLEADTLFKYHLNKFSLEITPLIKHQLTDNQFSALISFGFNVGVEHERTSTLLREVNENPLNIDIKHQFLRWVDKGTSSEKGLTRRRLAEVNLYFSNN